MAEEITPIFDIEDRGYRVRAFYLPETLIDSNQALVYVTCGSCWISVGYYWAYRVWNVAAHFRDWVDDFIADGEVTHA